MNDLRSSSTHVGDTEKMEDVILPGFRFHPTDEELVGFYLKKKIQHRPLSIELIKQLDIYKYDPWDLPKVAGGGEKEWYFYCPRDRKYRNSTRPNRVTGAGFWKATGTDRPIYSSDGGTKCIGLKKSLVFYKGRAAKGVKTDWMMHEFRLPSLTDSSASSKRFMDKSFPPNDSWAICKIFKKANSGAQRSLSHSWVSPIPNNTTAEQQLPSLISISSLNNNNPTTTTPSILHFCPENNTNYNNMFHCSSPTSTYTNFSSSNISVVTQNQLPPPNLNLFYPNHLPEASNYSINADNHHHNHIGVGVENNHYSYGVFPLLPLPVLSNTVDLAWKSSSSSCSTDDCTSGGGGGGGGYTYSAAATTKSFY